MFGQLPFAAALGAVLVLPELAEFELFDEFVELELVVPEELLSAADASAVPPPTRAPARASATADCLSHFIL